MTEPNSGPEDEMTLWQTAKSVAASFFGVQSSTNRKRDFSKGKPQHFIIIGLLMTLVFVGGVILAVQLVMKNAGL